MADAYCCAKGYQAKVHQFRMYRDNRTMPQGKFPQLVMRYSGISQDFTVAYVMTGGGPANATQNQSGEKVKDAFRN